MDSETLRVFYIQGNNGGWDLQKFPSGRLEQMRCMLSSPLDFNTQFKKTSSTKTSKITTLIREFPGIVGIVEFALLRLSAILSNLFQKSRVKWLWPRHTYPPSFYLKRDISVARIRAVSAARILLDNVSLVYGNIILLDATSNLWFSQGSVIKKMTLAALHKCMQFTRHRRIPRCWWIGSSPFLFFMVRFRPEDDM